MTLSLVLLTSVGIFLLTSIVLKGSTFDGAGSDATKQVNAAAHFNKWGGWASGMHKFAGGKARMKDVGVLLLVPMQRILKDKKGFYPVVLVSNMAQMFSGVLIYFVASDYWGTEAALMLFVLYAFSFFPYIIVFHGGLQVVAQMLLLISVFALQQVDTSLEPYNFFWYFVSGSSFGLMNYASASARKFIPVYLCALIYHISDLESPCFFTDVGCEADTSKLILLSIWSFVASSLVILSLSYKRLILKKYGISGETPCHFSKGKLFLKRLWYIFGGMTMLMTLIFSLFPRNESYLFLLCSVLGAILVFLYLNSPNLLENFRSYVDYWYIVDWGSHHRLYGEYFKEKYGKVFVEGEEGLAWYLLFFWRVIPVHLFLYFTAALIITWEVISVGGDAFSLLILVVVSLLPIVWGECSRGPKGLLPMYTTFVPLLIPIGQFFYIINQNNVNIFGFSATWIVGFVIILGVVWNVFVLISDILPSRMVVSNIMNKLDSLGVKTLYTYKTLFNYPFIDVVEQFYPNKYDIQYVDSLADIDSGYLFVPSIGSKSAYYQSVDSIGPVGNFKEDHLLTSLIESKKIRDCAEASFKTLGSSKYWQQIGNIVSFRDLILKEVKDVDRFYGLAWLVNIDTLHRMKEAN